jgi:molybdate transport system ATP-binding protein
MHLYYQENVAALQIVGSGFFDSIGLFRKCSEAQLAIASRWMEISVWLIYLNVCSLLCLQVNSA